jgi:PAS domain S-box-containing protein
VFTYEIDMYKKMLCDKMAQITGLPMDENITYEDLKKKIYFLEKQLARHEGRKTDVHGELLDLHCEDMARCRLAEEGVQASDRRFRIFIENISGISIHGYDSNHRVIFWNQASEELYKYTREEAMGRTLESLIIPAEMRDHVKNSLNRWMRNGTPIPAGEVTLVDSRGNPVPVYSSHVMHDTPMGKEIFCIDIDLGPLKAAEKGRNRAEKIAQEQKELALIGQITGKMAHDFNNILSVIMGLSELALMDCPEGEIYHTLDLILGQTLRGQKITRNLAAFARSQVPHREKVDLRQLLNHAMENLHDELSGIKVVQHHDPLLPHVSVDREMIVHVLTNLIQNAAHALSMTTEPMIRITTAWQDNTILLTMTDNGCGIPEENLEDVYDPAFTLKGSCDNAGVYDSKIKGSGYGLSTTKKNLDAHNCNIDIQSRFLEGTRVLITLPMTGDKMVKTPFIPTPATALSVEEKQNKRILLVEDETDISRVQSKILSSPPRNLRVDTAAEGKQALTLFNRNQYDLISLDYALPGDMNGMDIYHLIRQKNDHIPILFVSGNIEFLESIQTLIHRTPRVDVLIKPCRNTEYTNKIDQMLRMG